MKNVLNKVMLIAGAAALLRRWHGRRVRAAG